MAIEFVVEPRNADGSLVIMRNSHKVMYLEAPVDGKLVEQIVANINDSLENDDPESDLLQEIKEDVVGLRDSAKSLMEAAKEMMDDAQGTLDLLGPYSI